MKVFVLVVSNNSAGVSDKQRSIENRHVLSGKTGYSS